MTDGTRGGGQEARQEGQVGHPHLPIRISFPAPYLPLDGCWHLVALLHDAFEHWVAQAWERHGNGQGARGAPRTHDRKLHRTNDSFINK